MNWMTKAKCREYPTDLFFPEVGVNIGPIRQICAACPVQQECLEYALKHNIEHGVWGGTSRAQRETLARKMRAV